MCIEGTLQAVHDHGPLAHADRGSDRAVDDVKAGTAEPREAGHPVGRRTFLKRAALAGAGAALAAAVPLSVAEGARRPTRGPRPARPRFRDLTHVFRETTPVYSFSNPVRETLVTIERDGFYGQQWSFWEHSGTHVDAPGHFAAGRRLAPDLRPEDLVAPLVVIDISARAALDPDAEVTVNDLVSFERGHGRIPSGSLVAMYSGWESRVNDQEAYRNPGPDGRYHFPGFGLEAAEWLLAHRGIVAIGVDTLSLDPGPSTSFAVHHAVLGADRYGVENLRNLATIPPRGTTAFVGLVPWEAGSGGPARVIANW